MGFDQRIAIVTGASGGIGRATVRRLLQDGAGVMLAGLHQDRLDATRADLGREFDPARMATIACDVSREDQVIAAVDATIRQFGGWDYIVNNAGTMLFKKIEEQTEQDWRGILDVDLLGAFFFTKQAFLRMRRGGAIVNVSSVHAVETEPLVAPYAAAKAALQNFTVSLAGSLRGVNVTANVLTPGVIMVDGLLRFGRQRFGDPEMSFQDVAENFAKQNVFEMPPAGRVGTPKELAMVACLLASPLSGFITGANYRVDGGQVRGLN